MRKVIRFCGPSCGKTTAPAGSAMQGAMDPVGRKRAILNTFLSVQNSRLFCIFLLLMRNTALWAHWTGPFLSEALASVLGACAFSVTAPAGWNSLPSHIRLTVLTVSVTWKPTSTIVHSYPTATRTRLCIRGLHGAHAAIITPFISHCWSASCIYISQIRLAEDLALATGHTYIFRQAANFEVRCRAIVNVDKHTQTHTEERERERESEREISEFQVPVRYRPLQWTLLWVLCTTCEWASSSVCDRLSLPTHTATYNHQLNNWSTVGPTMEEGPWRFKTIRGTTSNCNCNPTLTLTLTLTWHRLPPKSRGFLCGPRATLISSFVKTGWVFYFCVILPTNK